MVQSLREERESIIAKIAFLGTVIALTAFFRFTHKRIPPVFFQGGSVLLSPKYLFVYRSRHIQLHSGRKMEVKKGRLSKTLHGREEGLYTLEEFFHLFLTGTIVLMSFYQIDKICMQ